MKSATRTILTRREALCGSALAGVQAIYPPPPAASGRSVAARNIHFALSLDAAAGLRVRLEHLPTRLVLADAPYSYAFGTPRFERVAAARVGNVDRLSCTGVTAEGLEVRHEFAIPLDRVWLEERLTIRNTTRHPMLLGDARAGFVLAASQPFDKFRITAVPYRREPHGGRRQYADYTLAAVLAEPRHSTLRTFPQVGRSGNTVTPIVHATGVQKTWFELYASEGWVWTDDQRGFVILKHNTENMEWALLDRVSLPGGQQGLRWGGCGVFEGDPEAAAVLAAGAIHNFGVTRVVPFDGGVTQGFYAYRSQMAAFGHGCPKGFDPPVHWNELYDNRLYWMGAVRSDEPENRKKFYSLADMRQEAAKARDIGCEALYLDPGWDTSFASKIWDAERLGGQREFAELLRREYGLKLSLHTPLSGWCNPTSYPRACDRMERDGSRAELSLCGASRQYLEETASRLDKLAREGATYFMFDGTMYHGECWDPAHGHAVPARRHEHVAATNQLARTVHARHPQVLIEMHDQMLGGTRLRYVPTYFGHGPVDGVAGFDSVWGFEMMWDPMKDLVGGPAILLYYYNLAYSLPLYIHVDLRKDNEHALMFWWNASTCRHLGIGGTHAKPEVRAAHKQAMTEYRRLKPFFAAGAFYGIDEQTHVHRHPSEPRAIIDCFNLEDRMVKREVVFDPWKFDLHPAAGYLSRGAPFTIKSGITTVTVEVPAFGHKLVEIEMKPL